MCGRLNITDSPAVRDLCGQLEISLWPEEGQVFSRFVRATNTVSIVFEQEQQQRIMRNAVWWLLLERGSGEHGQQTFKPSRYTSFNTRYDKLTQPGSAGYKAYKTQRCVIPVSGFGESQKTSNGMTYHDIQVADNGAMAMGGLYRTWAYTDEEGKHRQIYSCSVVTLPPHPKLQHIHQKSTPLMLSMHDGSLLKWLDAGTTNTDELSGLLVPKIRQPLVASPIDKPSLHRPIGADFLLAPDNTA